MDLADEYWEGTLRAWPRTATQVGEHRFDDRLEDLRPEAKAAEVARLERLLARATDPILRAQLESDLDLLAVPAEEWTVDPLEGPQVELLDMGEYQDAETAEQREAMVARWRAIGPYLDAHVENLRRGLARGRVGTRDASIKVVAQLDELLARPIEEWPLSAPGRPPELRAALVRALEEVVRPGYERLRAFVRDEVLPRAPGQDRVGLCFLDGGPEAYARLVRHHTTLAKTPEQIHETGLREVARVRAAMESLGARLFGTGDMAALRARVASDSSLFFDSREAVRAFAEETLQRAEAAVPAVFGRLPRTPCVVKPMEPHEEKYSTIAFYRPPVPGSRPGYYLVNTYLPETRPRYEAQALAFHEAVPGHHTQIALAQELPLPEFRRHGGVTAYVEGWGLYAESLADELGLYTSDLDRLGMHSFDAWRACRLVVDTGMHALGWSRQRAIDYMLANTLLAANNVENEVDRYVVWPGQALAYKLGHLALLELREEARAQGLDLKTFHDLVLGVGPVSLAILRDAVLTGT